MTHEYALTWSMSSKTNCNHLCFRFLPVHDILASPPTAVRDTSCEHRAAMTLCTSNGLPQPELRSPCQPDPGILQSTGERLSEMVAIPPLYTKLYRRCHQSLPCPRSPIAAAWQNSPSLRQIPPPAIFVAATNWRPPDTYIMRPIRVTGMTH